MSDQVAEVGAEYLTKMEADVIVLPERYKQTDVEVIPEGWEALIIVDVICLISGGTPSWKNSGFWNGSIPWVSGSTLKKFEISYSDQLLMEKGVANGSKMAPLNATLLLVRGSALHTKIRAGLVVAPVCFNPDVKTLVPKNCVHPKYLTIYLLAKESELLKLVSSAGSSADVLDTQLVHGFKFLRPPYKEQNAIATILSDMDAEIQALEQRRSKTRQIKQGMMEELLTGKKRLKFTEKERAYG